MAVRLTAPPQDEEDVTSFWLITYSDMTTLLLAFFLLMFSFTLMNEQRQDELLDLLNKVASTRQPQVDLRKKEELEKAARDIASQFAKDQTYVESTEEEVTVGLSSSVTFESGDATLTPQALAALDKVAEILVRIPNPIRIDGHTDDVPIRGRYASNWHLSAARAQSVVRVLMARGIDPRRIQVVGYADVKPRQPNESEAGRAANRRIEIKLLRQRKSA